MESNPKTDIVSVRNSIDAIDDEILSLLKKRISLAKQIGHLKDGENRAKWDPLRERQIYERLLKDNDDAFPQKALKSIFHEIITTCRLSQKKAVVAFFRTRSNLYTSCRSQILWPLSRIQTNRNH